MFEIFQILKQIQVKENAANGVLDATLDDDDAYDDNEAEHDE